MPTTAMTPFCYEPLSATQFELYDLSVDRDESNNLASTRPELVLELSREMAQALDDGWGVYGPLWPTFNGGGGLGSTVENNGPFVNVINGVPEVLRFTISNVQGLEAGQTLELANLLSQNCNSQEADQTGGYGGTYAGQGRCQLGR